MNCKKTRGDIVKKIIKILVSFILLIMLFIIIVILNRNNSKQNISYASTSNTSDIQLMARAINGEARGEPYEGQVAVRSSYIKQSKKFTVS